MTDADTAATRRTNSLTAIEDTYASYKTVVRPRFFGASQASWEAYHAQQRQRAAVLAMLEALHAVASDPSSFPSL